MPPPSPLGRWVPPAYTPVPLSGLLRASGAALTGRDGREQLARLLAERYAADRVVLTDSGTNALQLALASVVPSLPGRPVRAAFPAFACFDLVTAALGAGVEPVFFDLVPETLEPDWDSFGGALTSGVDVVVVAPLFGLSGGWPRVRRMADAAGVPLIEDAAQGFGSSPGGRPAGTLGDWSVLSFGRGKGWTGGGGGALLVRGGSGPVAEPSSSTPGAPGILVRSAAQWLLSHPSGYGVPARIPALHLGETRYHAPTPPARMAAASAVLALGSLEAAEREAERRRSVAGRLIREIAGEGAEPQPDVGYLRLPVLMPDGGAAEALAGEARTLGVERSYPRALPRLDALGESHEEERSWPGADALSARLVTLPTHSYLREGELRRLAQRVRAEGGRVVGVPGA